MICYGAVLSIVMRFALFLPSVMAVRSQSNPAEQPGLGKIVTSVVDVSQGSVTPAFYTASHAWCDSCFRVQIAPSGFPVSGRPTHRSVPGTKQTF